MDMPLSTLAEEPSPGVVGDETSKSRALACLLEYARDARVALPVHAGVELVEKPRVISVPGMPNFALGLMAWQGRHLPLIDLSRYLQDGATEAPTPFSHVLVVAYQPDPGQPLAYGALCAPFLIRLVEVNDSQQCPLPVGNERWSAIALSCFEYQGKAVPVIDTARIFLKKFVASPISSLQSKGVCNVGSELSGNA